MVQSVEGKITGAINRKFPERIGNFQSEISGQGDAIKQ